MKMISSTSTTSTSGVMLMSAREDWVRPLGAVNAITAVPPAFRVAGGTPGEAAAGRVPRR